MSRTRVLDLAKELGIETKVAIIKLQELGIQVKNHFNAISDLDASKLRSLHRSGKTTEKASVAKPVSKLIIRRKVETVAEDVDHSENETEVIQSAPVQAAPKIMTQKEVTVQPEVREPLKTETPKPTLDIPVEAPKVLSTETVSVAQKEKTQVTSQTEPIKPVSLTQEAPIQNQSSQTQKQNAFVKAPQKPQTPAAPASVAAAPATTNPTARPAFTGGAVIVRKAEPVVAQPIPPRRPPYQGQQPQGGAPYQRNQNGFNRDNVGNNQPRNQYNTNSTGGYTQNSQGGYRQQNQDPAAGSQGGYRPQNNDGGYRQNSEGGYRRGPDAPNGTGYRPQQFGGPGGAPRPGYNQAGVGAGSSSPRPGFPSAKPFVMSDAAPAAPVSKDLPSRIKYTDKDREKRRTVEEPDFKNAKNATRLKPNRFEDELLPDAIEGDFTGDQEEIVVRTMIPNRKKASGFKRREPKKVEVANPTKASKKILRIDESITVNDLASELSQKSTAVIKTLMKLGMMATINQRLDFDTANFVAQEFGFETQSSTVSIGDILTRKTEKQDSDTAETRPPIITIMGHVDHGKTSLLDAIRSAKVAAKEAGGITQHIGAYQIEYNNRKLTFLDTPGHEAFTAMRGRGAKVTDIVVLVVAADDGVMPQTIEAIAHAKAAQVPIIVAINKMDKPGVNVDRVIRELSEHQVISEAWGGDALFVQVSAKTHLGLNELIETILLQADVLDLKAQKDGLAEGIVIEAKLDKARGALATVIVTKGTLKQSDYIVVGKCLGRIRAIVNDQGQRLTQAEPATPVEIVGLDGVPESGDQFNCVASDAIAKEAVAFRIEKQRQKDLAGQRGSTMEELLAKMSGSTEEKPKELSIIIKADTHGSAEAIKSSILKLDTAKVKTKIIHSAVGGITETDAILAQASGAMIVGFNVRPDKMASQFAERAGVSIQFYSIIYQLTEAIQAAMLGTLAPVKQDKILGHAEVRTTFSVPKVGVIAGTMIIDGKVTRNSHIRIVRSGVVIYTGRVGSLKRFKDDAKEVAQGFECGISVENYNDMKLGDVLEAFIIEEIAPTLE